jgi:hypothetical protein
MILRYPKKGSGQEEELRMVCRQLEALKGEMDDEMIGLRTKEESQRPSASQ